MRRYLLLMMQVWFGCCVNAMGAFANQLNVSYLHMGNGLPSNFVDDIYEDDRGFVWIATHGGGLVRYDGYSYFNMGVGHSTIHLRSNYCRNVSQDGRRRLWISFDEYTDVLDLYTMASVVPECTTDVLKQRLRRILSERSMRVRGDSHGNMWIATREHIYMLMFDADGKVCTILYERSQDASPDAAFHEVEGLGMLVARNGEVRRYVVSQLQKGLGMLRETALPSTMACPENVFIADMLYHQGRLWLATNRGLHVLGDHPTVYRHDATPSSLSHDFVTALAISPDGYVMAGTLAGVDVLKENGFEHWNTASGVHPLRSNFVNCLLSRHGIVWVGTESGGIAKLVPRRLHLRNYVHGSAPGSISPNAVNTIYMDHGGTMWVGTVEGGLNRLAPGAKGFVHYTSQNSRLSHNTVSALAADASGHLWIGTWGGGVNRISMNGKGVVEPLEATQPEHDEALSFVGALAYDNYNKVLWIGTNDGIYFYDEATGLIGEPFAGSKTIRGCIGSLIDRDGVLWMGCLDGVVKIDLKHRRGARFAHRQLRYKLDEPSSGIIDKITSFCQTSDGTVWLGSSGYGMYRRETDAQGRERFKAFTVADGMASNNVRGMAQGKDGRLWVATEHGLSVFNPKTESFTNYGEEDGLLSAQFYFNGAVSAPDGRVFLGTTKGLTEVGSLSSGEAYQGRLSFTALSVNGQTVLGGSRFLDEDVTVAKEIRLEESDKSFVIAFSGLNFQSERQGGFSYCMKGYDDKWVQLQSGEHAVKYTSLPPGSYEFVVRYMLGADNDIVQEISINVEVSPYVWKRWWFVTTCALLTVVLIARIYFRRIEKTKRRERERILEPIIQALAESDSPQLLQRRIEGILGNHKTYTRSKANVVEADRQEVVRHKRPFLERVMAVMEQNYANADFGVTELSDALHISKTVLSKHLNAEMGVPTGRFMRNYRLEIAKKLLSENEANRNITEIAYRVGFNDAKYFTRCFTKLYGISPSSYKAEK